MIDEALPGIQTVVCSQVHGYVAKYSLCMMLS